MAIDTTDRRRFVWDLIDTRWPELWDQPAPLKVSEALVRQITEEMVARFPTGVLLSGTRNGRNNAMSQQRRMVRRWLENPDKWSPLIDPVAMRRALDFDWAVISRLTLTERDTFLTELACMDDPWSERDVPGDPEAAAKKQWRGGVTMSARRVHFLSGPERVRRHLCNLVSDRRKAMEVAA